jgi:hypothetical protein
MPERDPIDLIKEQMNGIDTLGGLQADHEAFQQWHAETKTILEKAFSSKSIHYQSFLALRFREMTIKAFASPEIDKINSQRYKRDLEHAKNILYGAMKELTLDRTLFKKIQTTPKRVEFSLKGEYFISSGISDTELTKTIESAFEGSGLKPIYGGDIAHGEKFLHQKIDQIRRSKFGIYHLTTPENPDTLLELGIALGLGKEVTLLCQRGTLLSEGIEQLNPIEYENFSDLLEKLQKKVA